ncbi:hypothetical protein VNO78_06442 [Psophocarpus tetragonolobus]|uniref:Uncharacterized protein n=1 Tax=Psophocarpus tetragonolobus TaxID=3891 RepID=A0AAN9T1L7_PSOTE
MSNLRLLAFQAINGDLKKINSVNLPKGLESLPKNLRYFVWDGYPLKSLPSIFCPEKLVEISMPYSNVEKLWNGVQCPNLCGAPNLKDVILSDCKSLARVDPSIFSLPKLESLDVSGCTSLKSLCSYTCSSSLRGLYASRCYNLQEFSVVLLPNSSIKRLHLYLAGWDLNEQTSSLLHDRNLGNFTFQISEDHTRNFAYQVTFTSRKHESDSLMTLHKVLHSSCFQYVSPLTFANCHCLFELQESVSLLSSLEHLRLLGGDAISLPESIKYLPQLKYLEVLELMKKGPKSPSALFPNCINLDQHSYDTILKYAIARIELGENEELTSLDHDDANLFSVETVKNQSCYVGSFGCECSLETDRGGRMNIKSFFVDEITLLSPDHLFEMMSDHGFLWYDAKCCKQIMETIKERKAMNDRSIRFNNPELTFKFFAQTLDDEEIVIKECGFRWIYPSKDQYVEQRGEY